MKRILSSIVLTALCLTLAAAPIKLKKQGSATLLTIGGKPMLILGGELSNSAAASTADIDSVMPKMARLGLNTVFVPAQWDLTEPEEGRFDFTLIDETVRKARENNLKIVFLWFGAWKNSMSCYAPLWFKRDTKRFPRAMTEDGKPLEIATAFSKDVLEADKKAFCRFMSHIKEIDSGENTVIMIQVENEIGMLESARDHCPLAEAVYRKEKGKWQDDEQFQAHHYALYTEQIAKAGKAIYDIPMYVNAAMNSRGRKPGEYPSAGPLAHLMKIWKAAAPHIDIYAPDIYDTGFKDWVAQYKRADNPFFTPETRLVEGSGVRALYVFGEVDAMAFSPFAIDQARSSLTENVSRAYDLIRQLTPTLIQKQGKGETWGLLFDQQDKERIITDESVVMTCRHYFTLPWDPRATDGSTWQEGGGIIIKLGKYDYLIAGSGIVVTFQTSTEKKQENNVTRGEDGFAEQGSAADSRGKRFVGKRLGIGYVDQVRFDDTGQMQFVRRDNGDQSHQGRHARIASGEYKILHVKLYEY